MTKKKVQPPAKPYAGWGLYNWGNPLGVCTSRREAIRLAQEMSGEPWSKCREYFRAVKVEVKPL
jgi:hypothetical protein